MANQHGLERYKGFLIFGSALPQFATGFDWYAQGTVFRSRRRGSVLQVKRIQGPVFHTKEAADLYGLQLCKEWIEKGLESGCVS